MWDDALRSSRVYLCAGLALSIGAASAECPRYVVDAILDDGSPHYTTHGHDLSDAGYVVGQVQSNLGNDDRPFVWWGEGNIELIPLGSHDSGSLEAVNDDRIAVGNFMNPGQLGFIYDGNTGTIEYIHPPSSERLNVVGLSPDDIVFGHTLVDELLHPFIIDNGVLRVSRSAAGGAATMDGQMRVVGGYHQLWSWDAKQDTFTELGRLPNALNNTANGVNARGDVVGATGYPANPPQSRATVWRLGTPSELPQLYDFRVNTAVDVNADGQIVGVADDSLSGDHFRTGVLWEGSNAYDLRLITDPGDDSVWVKSAVAINDNGHILVGAIVGDGSTSSDQVVVLRRVPALVGDITCDLVVEFDDLLVILSSWHKACSDCHADIDGDSIVGPSDLMILLANWG